MEVFDRYAAYYDLFYREKNYAGEVDYVDALIKRYAMSETKTILDLGCGTGRHAVLLAQKGYRVTGVDRSDTMLTIANEKKRQKGVAMELQKGDICTVDLRKRFDVAIAMFAVMGYQTTNEAFESALRNAAKHLNPGGLLIFDAWFGPAVLAQKPQDKIFVTKEGTDTVIRLTRPELNVMTHTVTVNFTVLHIENDKILNYVEEAHHMRFFFPMELRYFFKVTGFDVLAMLPFMATDVELSDGDWNAMIVAKKA